MTSVGIGIATFGLFFGRMFHVGGSSILISLSIGFFLMGLSFGPLGTLLSELFPTSVRYTGSSLVISFGGIVGASLAPNVARWLAVQYGIAFVGYYLTFAAALSLLGLLLITETSRKELTSK